MSYFSTIVSFHALNSCASRKTTRVMRRPGSASAPRVDLRLADAAGQHIPAAREEASVERLRLEHPVADDRDQRRVVTDMPYKLGERHELVFQDRELAPARGDPARVGGCARGRE